MLEMIEVKRNRVQSLHFDLRETFMTIACLLECQSIQEEKERLSMTCKLINGLRAVFKLHCNASQAL